MDRNSLQKLISESDSFFLDYPDDIDSYDFLEDPVPCDVPVDLDGTKKEYSGTNPLSKSIYDAACELEKYERTVSPSQRINHKSYGLYIDPNGGGSLVTRDEIFEGRGMISSHNRFGERVNRYFNKFDTPGSSVYHEEFPSFYRTLRNEVYERIVANHEDANTLFVNNGLYCDSNVYGNDKPKNVFIEPHLEQAEKLEIFAALIPQQLTTVVPDGKYIFSSLARGESEELYLGKEGVYIYPDFAYSACPEILSSFELAHGFLKKKYLDFAPEPCYVLYTSQGVVRRLNCVQGHCFSTRNDIDRTLKRIFPNSYCVDLHSFLDVNTNLKYDHLYRHVKVRVVFSPKNFKSQLISRLCAARDISSYLYFPPCEVFSFGVNFQYNGVPAGLYYYIKNRDKRIFIDANFNDDTPLIARRSRLRDLGFEVAPLSGSPVASNNILVSRGTFEPLLFHNWGDGPVVDFRLRDERTPGHHTLDLNPVSYIRYNPQLGKLVFDEEPKPPIPGAVRDHNPKIRIRPCAFYKSVFVAPKMGWFLLNGFLPIPPSRSCAPLKTSQLSGLRRYGIHVSDEFSDYRSNYGPRNNEQPRDGCADPFSPGPGTWHRLPPDFT